MSTKLYKIHLKREGKDIEGIQKLLIRDLNRQHQAAQRLMIEVKTIDDDKMTSEWIERAVNKVMKQSV